MISSAADCVNTSLSVRRPVADGGIEVAVADRDDERQVPRPQQLQRRDQFLRAFLIDKIGEDHDERPFF